MLKWVGWVHGLDVFGDHWIALDRSVRTARPLTLSSPLDQPTYLPLRTLMNHTERERETPTRKHPHPTTHTYTHIHPSIHIHTHTHTSQTYREVDALQRLGAPAGHGIVVARPHQLAPPDSEGQPDHLAQVERLAEGRGEDGVDLCVWVCVCGLREE
jgi:hypothetical protein